MSTPPFGLPSVPLMTPAAARDIARGHMALAEQYRLVGMDDRAFFTEQQAQTWLAYASVLDATKGAWREGV
jgi:hypothetical protein